MFGDNIFDELMEMIGSKECYSNSNLVFKCITNSIESYESIVDRFKDGRIILINLSDEDIGFLNDAVIAINQNLATSVLVVAEMLKKSKLDPKEFTAGVDTFLKEKNLELIAFSDIILALEAYGNHLRIEELYTDQRYSMADLSTILTELDSDYKAGLNINIAMPVMLWALLGKATEKISMVSETEETNNRDTIVIFIEAFASIFRITSFFGFDVHYLIDILKDEKVTL